MHVSVIVLYVLAWKMSCYSSYLFIYSNQRCSNWQTCSLFPFFIDIFPSAKFGSYIPDRCFSSSLFCRSGIITVTIATVTISANLFLNLIETQNCSNKKSFDRISTFTIYESFEMKSWLKIGGFSSKLVLLKK